MPPAVPFAVPPFKSLVPPWQAGPDQALLETRIFRIRTHAAASPTSGHQAPFVIMDTADWVNVIARTDQGEVVLVEQFRHGTGQVTVEIPGGMVDPGESALEAGLRELAEETGYRPGPDSRPLVIGTVEPNPAIQSNRCSTVLVDGVVPGPARPDPSEELGVRCVPSSALDELVRQGVITHALVVAAFLHLRLHEG